MPGRLYPITLKYCPLTPAEQAASLERIDPAPYVRLLQHIDNTYSISERGDLLVFLSGMAEIQVGGLLLCWVFLVFVEIKDRLCVVRDRKSGDHPFLSVPLFLVRFPC